MRQGAWYNMRVVDGSVHDSPMEDGFEFREDDYRIQPLRQRIKRSKLREQHRSINGV